MVPHQAAQATAVPQTREDTADHLVVDRDTVRALLQPDTEVHHQADTVQEAVQAQKRLCQEVTNLILANSKYLVDY